MQSFVMYSRLDWDEGDAYPKAEYGDPPSAEIGDIASRLLGEGSDLGDGSLCERCASLGLRRSVFDKKPNGEEDAINRDEEIVSLGLLHELSQRKCGLCWLVARLLEDEHKMFETWAVEGDANVALYWTDYEDLQELDYHRFQYRICARLTLPKGESTRKSRLMIEPFSDPRNPELLSGRVYGENEIDVELLRTWIHCCGEWHNGECKTSFRTRLEHLASKMVMYGIDVNDMQLKKLTEADRYCTLSYVWRSRPFYRLTKENLDKLMAVNSVSNISRQVPKTIMDAICLTRDLGIRFLWVDSLCIPQDDEAYKAEAIGKMHLVYSKAEVTIVAASGSDSFYGLPGYGGTPRDTPQAVRKFGNEGLILGIRPRYQATLMGSPHGKRGWTYQEVCFSPRSVVFLNGTVYFQCQQAVWREDRALEHRGVKFWLHEMDNRLKEKTDLLGQYRHSLREHTRRKLSFQGDAVNAFTGILEAQSVLLRFDLGQALCGMHIRIMDWLILFYSRRSTIRRMNMPSWSWAGWIGEAFAPFPMFGSLERLLLWISEHCPASYQYFPDFGIFGMPEIKHVLRIKTLAATFKLDAKTIDGPGFDIPLWVLRDSRRYMCGFVSLHSSSLWDFKFSLPQHVQEGLVLNVEVLVLSDTVSGQGNYPTTSSEIPYDPDAESGEETVTRNRWQIGPFTGREGQVRPEFGEKPLDQYNVIVVLPTLRTVGEQEVGGLYEKIGAGVIHNQALSWAVDSPPSWKEFLIV